MQTNFRHIDRFLSFFGGGSKIKRPCFARIVGSPTVISCPHVISPSPSHLEEGCGGRQVHHISHWLPKILLLPLELMLSYRIFFFQQQGEQRCAALSSPIKKDSVQSFTLYISKEDSGAVCFPPSEKKKLARFLVGWQSFSKFCHDFFFLFKTVTTTRFS